MIVVKDGEVLRATTAAARLITIVILFKDDPRGDTVVHEDGFPEIQQRRVDVTFTSKHVLTTQVRSTFCVLCSLFCVLLLAT